MENLRPFNPQRPTHTARSRSRMVTSHSSATNRSAAFSSAGVPRRRAIINPFVSPSCSIPTDQTPSLTDIPAGTGLDFLLLTEASQRAEYLERSYVATEVKRIVSDVLARGRRPIDPADISHLRTRWNELQHHTAALDHYWDTIGFHVRKALCGTPAHATNNHYPDEVRELTAKIASAYQLGLSVNDAWEQWQYPDQVSVHRRSRFFEPKEGRSDFLPTSARYYFEPTIAELMQGPRHQLFHHSIDLFIFRTTYGHSSGQRFCTYSVYSDYNWQQQYATGIQPEITEQFDSAQEFPSLADALDYLRDALFFGDFSHSTN